MCRYSASLALPSGSWLATRQVMKTCFKGDDLTQGLRVWSVRSKQVSGSLHAPVARGGRQCACGTQQAVYSSCAQLQARPFLPAFLSPLLRPSLSQAFPASLSLTSCLPPSPSSSLYTFVGRRPETKLLAARTHGHAGQSPSGPTLDLSPTSDPSCPFDLTNARHTPTSSHPTVPPSGGAPGCSCGG